MSNVLQILSSNYSGKSVNITFSPLTGESQSFENVSLPYNFVNNTFDGNYSLFFPDYNLTHKFQIPTTDPTNTKCRCTEFSYNSFLGGTSKNSYRACNGSLRKLTLLNGQTYRDCVRINQYTAGTNTNVSVFGYCDSVNDCIQLTQPVTPTQTRTPTPTLSLTPTYTPTSTVTTTQTPSFTPSVTPTTSVGATGDCMCTTIRNLNNSETNISFNLCKYPDWGNPYVVLTLSPNGETRICVIYNTISGDNISISYEYGLCESDGSVRACPQPTPTPTPSPSNTNLNFNNKLLYFDNEGLKVYDIINDYSFLVNGYPHEEVFQSLCFDENFLYVLNTTDSYIKKYQILSLNPFLINNSNSTILNIPNLLWIKMSLIGTNKFLITSQINLIGYVVFEEINGVAIEVDRVSERESSLIAIVTETNPKKQIFFGPSFRQSINYLEDEYIGEISGILSISQIGGVFFHKWDDENNRSINFVKNNGDILKVSKTFPYNFTFIRNIQSSNINSISQIYGRLEYDTFFDPPLYLSGITSNIIYSLSNNSLNLEGGSIVSGFTYNKSLKNFNSIYKSVNVNGLPIPNIETKYKVVNYIDFTDSKYWRYMRNILSLSVVSGYTSQFSFNPIDYNFSIIEDDTPEIIHSFSEVIKIRIDISQYVWNLRTSDENLYNRVNEIVNKIESFPQLSNLDFTFECEVVYWTEDTIFDNISITNYQNYYDNLGGIFTYTGNHIGIVWNNLSYANGITNSTGGFYIQIAGNNSIMVNTSEIWDTFIHEIGHSLSLIHTFDCEWKDVYNELQFDYLDNTDDSTYGCLNCGYYTPYLNEYIGTESEGCGAIMGYGKFDFEGCSSPANSESVLDSQYQKFVLNSDVVSFGTNENKNVTYFNFLDGNEIQLNDISSITITVGNNSSSNLSGVIDSISLVLLEGEEIEIVQQRNNFPNPIVINLNLNDIEQIFDYSNQSNFGVKLSRQKVSDGTTNWNLGSYGLNITFNTFSGNNILSRKPRNYTTLHNGEQIQVPKSFISRASRFNSYEINILNDYVNFISRSYFNL